MLHNLSPRPNRFTASIKLFLSLQLIVQAKNALKKKIEIFNSFRFLFNDNNLSLATATEK